MINLVSLFSGAGGLDLAFKQVGGFRNSLVIEYERAFFETLGANICKNRSSQRAICADIRELNPANYFDNMEHPIGVIGGPPCETFSSMGGRSATKNSLSRN